MSERQDTTSHVPVSPPAFSGRVALVHDFLLYRGGAERVLRSLADLFPEAPIYTLLFDPEGMKGMFRDREVRTSFLGSWPGFVRRRHRLLLPLYPTAAEAIDLRDFDLVLSSSGAWMKGIVTRLYTKHIAYLHSPMRFVWDENERYLVESGGFHFLKRTLLSYLRMWDKEASLRPDMLLANSHYTAQRIEKYYRRTPRVVFPPVRPFLSQEEPAHFLEDRPFLTVARLSKYKHTEALVSAFTKLELPLVVVGTGRERARLKHHAGPTVLFAGDVSDEKLGTLYSSARAFVFAGEEDFGLALAEASYAGLPVITLSAGGAREIVEEGVSGIFFSEPTEDAVLRAVREYLKQEPTFDREMIRIKASRFSEATFHESMRTAVREVMGLAP